MHPILWPIANYRLLFWPSSVSLTASLEERAETAVAELKVDNGKNVMPGPPGLMVTNAAGEVQIFDVPTVNVPQLQLPRPDKGKRVMSSPPGSINTSGLVQVLSRDREYVAPPRTMLNRTKRVMSGPERPLRRPQKLAGTAQGRWSDVPTTWKPGVVDPLRCHSVENLQALE